MPSGLLERLKTKARAAAEEAANLHNYLTRIEVMIGAILAMQLPILIELFAL